MCKFLHSQENERTKDMIVEQKFHRTIIGQKGEKIKEVRDKFPEVNLLLLPVHASVYPALSLLRNDLLLTDSLLIQFYKYHLDDF